MGGAANVAACNYPDGEVGAFSVHSGAFRGVLRAHVPSWVPHTGKPVAAASMPNGHVLVAYSSPNYLEEMTHDGDHVRFLDTLGPLGHLSHITGLACSGTAIAVANGFNTYRGHGVIFDLEYGLFRCAVGNCTGTASRTATFCTGVNFTPDGKHVLIAVGKQAFSVAVYTEHGAFVKSIGRGWLRRVVTSDPAHIAFAESGELVLVSDTFHSRVCVFAMATGQLVCAFGTCGVIPAPVRNVWKNGVTLVGDADATAFETGFTRLAAMAVYNGQLYILDKCIDADVSKRDCVVFKLHVFD